MNGKRRRKLGSVIGVTALLAALAVPTSLPASAVEVPDQVLAWNQHAYDELIVTKLQPPPVAVMNLALVHGAVYDAVNAIDGGYEPYLGAPAASPSYSEDAAAAAAAYRVLLYLVPDREAQLTGYYNDSFGRHPERGCRERRRCGGEAAAAAMILERTGDGRNGTALFTEGTRKGEWRRVPLVTGGNAFRWVGQVDPFLIRSAAQFATLGPKRLGSDAYAREFRQVKRLGRATGSTRTADQTSQALFWADHAVAMWTRIFRQISDGQRPVDRRQRPILRDALPDGRRRVDRVLRGQGAEGLLAAADRDPGSRDRRQPSDASPIRRGPRCSRIRRTRTTRRATTASAARSCGRCSSSSGRTSCPSARRTSPRSRTITRSFTRFSQAIREILRARVFGGLHFWTADAQAVTSRPEGCELAAGRTTSSRSPESEPGGAPEAPRPPSS